MNQENYDIGVNMVVDGIDIENFVGNLKDGLVIRMSLEKTKGQAVFHLQYGMQCWVSLLGEDAKILSLD